MTSRLGLLARIDARPENADKVERMLTDAVDLARQEEGTVTWFAFRLGAASFGIFDTFADEQGRTDHLNGRIAAALGDSVALLATAPTIEQVDILAATPL
ncbi:antibiotic biosynthesis monooxygenase [Streptacidiphilus pinicola]|uniref:Antibiotic biosynthesis monooxygenase n=1 Tax=Streptacidiphilus pinicola TaxID=2219663 RepID=A0A2X0I8Q5_9ACTN|nr:antibiotic biosynthesis monooxygenase [Streptacidiphilus pinicola]RAG81274.1 antibiotic biosynthesis monooxygenase [Streptacidiphilus pinicola]